MTGRFLGAYQAGPNNTPENGIYTGDARELAEAVPSEAADAVLIDPPYGEGLSFAGDGSIAEASVLLQDTLRTMSSRVVRGAHFAIFWTMRNLDVCIDMVRSCGLTYRRTLSMYVPRGSARPYLGWLPRTQAIVIAQKYLPLQPPEMHDRVAEYLFDMLKRSEFSRGDIATMLNCDSRLVMKWTRIGDPAWCLPTPRFYGPLKAILGLDDRFDVLLYPRDGKRVSGRGFNYHHDCYIVDNTRETDLHQSQKPLSVVRHIVQCIADEGECVVDMFCGSGTTAVACKETGRQYLAFEISSRTAALARDRVARASLPLFDLPVQQAEMVL